MTLLFGIFVAGENEQFCLCCRDSEANTFQPPFFQSLAAAFIAHRDRRHFEFGTAARARRMLRTNCRLREID